MFIQKKDTICQSTVLLNFTFQEMANRVYRIPLKCNLALILALTRQWWHKNILHEDDTKIDWWVVEWNVQPWPRRNTHSTCQQLDVGIAIHT